MKTQLTIKISLIFITLLFFHGGFAAYNPPSTQIQSSDIGSAQIGANQLATGAVGTNQLAAGAVGTNQIAAGAVGTNQIAAQAVTSAKIGTGAVGTAQIANGAVGGAQISCKFSLTGTVFQSTQTGWGGTWNMATLTLTAAQVASLCPKATYKLNIRPYITGANRSWDWGGCNNSNCGGDWCGGWITLPGLQSTGSIGPTHTWALEQYWSPGVTSTSIINFIGWSGPWSVTPTYTNYNGGDCVRIAKYDWILD